MRLRLPLLVAALSSMVMVQPVQANAPRSDGNGFIMMVHATFEPRPTEASPVFVPPAHEALAGTRHGGDIVFNVIPHRLDGRPAMVSNPVLQITDVKGGNELLVPANGVSTSQRECIEETAYAGYEGPVEACRVFRLPASALKTMPLVLLTLRFNDGGRPGTEVNNPAAHGLLHLRQQGAPVDLASVDSRLTGQSIPFAVLDLFDSPTFGTMPAGAEQGMSCKGAYNVSFSPSLPSKPVSNVPYHTGGESGTFDCGSGGTGTIGIDGRYGTEGPVTCTSSGEGWGVFSYTMGGKTIKDTLTFDFGGAAGGFSGRFYSEHYSGTFTFTPTEGDCVNTPVTKADVRTDGRIKG